MDEPGYYQGRHFSTYVEEVKALKRNKDLEKAEELLLQLVDATERLSMVTGMGVAPWYYSELAKIYRKRRDYASEVAILKRLSTQGHAPGSMPRQLMARLEKARLAGEAEPPIAQEQEAAEADILREFDTWRNGERGRADAQELDTPQRSEQGKSHSEG